MALNLLGNYFGHLFWGDEGRIFVGRRKSSPEDRLEAVGWGLFLMMVGRLLLIPGDQIAEGV